MPSKRKQIISCIIFNFSLSLVISDYLTKYLTNDFLLSIPLYIISSLTIFTVFNIGMHKLFKETIKEAKKSKNDVIESSKTKDKVIEPASNYTRNKKLVRTLKK